MSSPASSREYVPLSRLPAETGLSISTWRRAIRSAVDPLPCIRVGLGDPMHARILVRRIDLDAWLLRRNAEARPQARALVEEIVARVTEGA